MNQFRNALFCALLFCVITPNCLAQTAAKILPQSQPLLPADALEKVKLGGAPTEIIDVTGQTFARALRVRVPQTTGDSNKVQITIDSIAPVQKGDVLLATLAARGQSAIPGDGAQMMFLFERNSNPYTKSVTRGVSLPDAKGWRRVAIPFVAQETYAAGEVMTSLRLARKPSKSPICRCAISALILRWNGCEPSPPIWRRWAQLT